jgi:HEAT repeat protein
MGGTLARTVAGLACLVVIGGTTARADEPFWNARPLSHWLGVLQSGDAAARTEAARGLTEIALAHGAPAILPALPQLIAALHSSAIGLRVAATAALEQIGPSATAAVPTLLELFEQDPDADIRAHAGLALTQVARGDARVVEACGRVLGLDADVRVRQAAAASLVQAGPASLAVQPALQRAISDGDAIVRVFAAAAIGQLGKTSEALPVLLAGLTHEDPVVRAEAAGLLASVAPAHAAVVAPLISALADDDAQVRQAAADALGRIGQPAQSAIQPLWRLIRDPDEGVRESAVRAIRRIRD